MTRSIVVGSGPGTRELPIGVFNDLDFARRSGDSFEGITPTDLRYQLSDLLLSTLVAAPDATLAWTTQPGILVTHDLAKQVITVPAAASLTDWPVGRARPLVIGNTGGFGVGFAALLTVGFQFAAVNNAITTLKDSDTASSLSELIQAYTVYRFSAAMYLIWKGV